MIKMIFPALLLVVGAFFLAPIISKNLRSIQGGENTHNKTIEQEQKKEEKKMTLKITDVEEGKGKEAKKGSTILVHYRGKLENGTEFDASYNRGQPLSFKLGVGQVIKGWDEGVLGMKVGGKRNLFIPSDMGYGARGAGNVIPPNSNLIFDVELVDVID